MAIIKRVQGERVNSHHKTEGGQPRETQLKCGHFGHFRVLPRNGDFVYCRRCKGYTEVGSP